MLAENFNRLRQELGQVNLVVVSKYRTIEEIMQVYEFGQRLFAENRVQALLERREALPHDISWHLIGHLQTNKVKYIAPFIDMIQSVDTIRLLDEIDRQAANCQRTIDCLLQIHIADEETKFGMDKSYCIDVLEQEPLKRWPNIRLRGMMGMATNTDDMEKVKSEFADLKIFYDQCAATYFDLKFDTLSMGMSSDYKVAIECGSNLVRIGSKVFEP